MSRERGFTLIEMMVVVAIIAVVAAIAIPNLLRSKVQSNEAATIENLRQIGAAQIVHHGARDRFGDFAALVSVADGPNTGFLDNSWSEGVVKNGYVYTMAEATTGSFVCFADPENLGTTGTRHFRIDTSGIIRWSTAGQPDATATPIGS
jgi:prepilin-type N-terminal cleavage/methylation domain-containing protein